jgi:hypothetical protein
MSLVLLAMAAVARRDPPPGGALVATIPVSTSQDYALSDETTD